MAYRAVLVGDGSPEYLVLEKELRIVSRSMLPPRTVAWRSEPDPPARSEVTRLDYEFVDTVEAPDGPLRVYGLRKNGRARFDIWVMRRLVSKIEIHAARHNPIPATIQGVKNEGLTFAPDSVVLWVSELEHPDGVMIEAYGAARKEAL